MDERSIELLEYPEVRERLASYAAFAPSRRLAQALVPSADPVVVRRRLDETDEARWLLGERPDVGIGGARDVGAHIERAARGGRLEPTDLLAVGETLVAAARLSDALREQPKPLLHELYRSIAPLPALRLRLETAIEPGGQIADAASPQLGGLRRAVRVAYERLRARLDSLVHSELSGALQEPIVTLRNGRYVVPVKAEARGRVRGIVHDQSGSGQTLFVEPLVAVDLANAWREAQLAATAEEERILDELSAEVGGQREGLVATLDALARFDHWMCRARLAEEMDAIRAEPSRGREVVLLSARHPGLTGTVVPIDLRLGGDYTALVVTGPNTGGKTVALRTVGLLALMHQAGLHIPVAPGSTLPVFRDVLADIGDEQSVAQSLSTFSGHLRTIIRIVGLAGEGTLVLLDELGAGTDPTEGSALAQALLDHFIRAGALVIATTHYADLKTYAHNTPEARNASVEFDVATLAPTYRLSIGLPGTSQAFSIAERLGLAPELVADARSRLSSAEQEFEATLASIRDAGSRISEAEARASEAERKARAALDEAEEERRRARTERNAVLAEARRQADLSIGAIEAEVAEIRGALARETLTEARLDRATQRLEARRSAIPHSGPPLPTSTPSTRTWHVGDRAVAPGGWDGIIRAIDAERGRASLEVGGMRLGVDLGTLRAPGEAPPQDLAERAPPEGAAGRRPAPSSPPPPRSGRRGDFGPASGGRTSAGAAARGSGVAVATTRAGRSSAGGAGTVASSLDLRGARVDEALELLDAYLDRAAHADAGRVTIVHGHGSGAMRDAVRVMLDGHPLVREWRPGDRGEGGDGATIVTL
jgi:DNA mismatch repair protein MutS2